MQIIRTLWRDERGETSVASMLLIIVIVGLGMIVGLSTLRDHVVQSFGDAASALESLNQSYTVMIGTVAVSYTDPGPFPVVDPVNAAPAGLDLTVAPTPE